MKKKRRKKKKTGKVILSVAGFLVIAAAVVVLLFRTRSIEVEGSSYYSDNTVTTWIQNDRLSVNTLYVLLKYDLFNGEVPTGIERFDVSLKNPWTLRVKVEEKEMAGYVDDNGAYLCFDGTGTAILRTKKAIEGVPYIEGLVFDASKAEVGKKLPVEDDGIFEDIVDVSQNLRKYDLAPDRITCADGGLSLYFGIVEVALGSGEYEVKLQQVEPILAKLTELYPETAGTLHLENYTSESESVRFVPAS